MTVELAPERGEGVRLDGVVARALREGARSRVISVGIDLTPFSGPSPLQRLLGEAHPGS